MGSRSPRTRSTLWRDSAHCDTVPVTAHRATNTSMKRTALTALVAALAVLSCKDSSGPKAGPPALMVPVGELAESSLAGEDVQVHPTVLVTDAQSQPVPGVTVTFSIVQGGGTVTGGTQVTNSRGVATLGGWKLGRSFGINRVVAIAGDLVTQFDIRALAPDAGVLAFDVADPAGDTMAHADSLRPAMDLVRMRGDFKRDSLILTMTFASPVRPANEDVFNSIGGEIEMDMDDNAQTGYGPPDSNNFGASAVLGVDYLIDLFDSFPTLLLVQSANGTRPVHASFPGNSVVIRLPLATLGDDDGNFALALVLGPYTWASDIFPNSGQLEVRGSITGSSSSSIVTRSLMLSPHDGTRRASWKPTLPGW